MRILRFIGLLILVLLTATLFAEKRPKIMLINSNASVERYKVAQEEFKKACEQKDELALRVVNDCAVHLGYGAVTLIHLLSPERIVFGGGVMEALGDEMLPTVRDVVEERCLKGCAEGIEILPAKLGDDAGVLGAAALALQASSE